MKTIIINTSKKIVALFCGLLVSMAGFSQSHVTMSLMNISTTSNTIEYDLYMINDGNTTLKLSACSYGVNFDKEILNGGTISYSYVERSRSRGLEGLTKFTLASTQVADIHQVRMTSMPCGFADAPALLPDVPFKVGRFRITNSVSWTSNSLPSLALMESGRMGLTTTQIVAYAGTASLLKALTPALQTVKTTVDVSPILNPSELNTNTILEPSGQELIGTNTIMNEAAVLSVYPNPVMDELNIRFVNSEMSTVNIFITDLHGHLVKRIQATAIKGTNNVSIDLSGLGKGIYALRIIDSKVLNYSQTFMKQ